MGGLLGRGLTREVGAAPTKGEEEVWGFRIWSLVHLQTSSARPQGGKGQVRARRLGRERSDMPGTQGQSCIGPVRPACP